MGLKTFTEFICHKGGQRLGQSSGAKGVWSHQATTASFAAIHRGADKDDVFLCHISLSVRTGDETTDQIVQ